MNINLTENRPDQSVPPPATAIANSRTIIEAAKAEASRLVQQAELEAESIRSSARKRGIEEATLFVTEQAIRLECSMEAELQNNEQRIMDIALAVASAVIGDAIKQQPESILPRIKRAASKIVPSEELQLSVNPNDIPYVSISIDELSKNLGNLPFKIVEDPSLDVGDAKLTTSSSVIHSTVGGHLAAIKSHFLCAPTFKKQS